MAAIYLSSALPVLAAEPAPETAPAQPAPAVRQPLPERSQEDAAALERQVPAAEQQQLQAAQDTFLALWKPANSSDPSGVVVIVPGAGENADWPRVVGPLRNKLPDANWASLSLSLPDLRSEASQPRAAEPEKIPTEPAPNSSSKEASTTAKPIEQAADKAINFGIMSTESSQNLKSIWQPFLDDMHKKTGLTINATFASDYAGLIQGMRFNKVDVAWLGNKAGT